MYLTESFSNSSMYNPYDPFLANSLAQIQATGGLGAADPRLQNLAGLAAAAGAPTAVSVASPGGVPSTVATAGGGAANVPSNAAVGVRGPQGAAGFAAGVGMNNAAALAGIPQMAAAHNHFSLQAASLAANQAAAAAYGAAGLPAA